MYDMSVVCLQARKTLIHDRSPEMPGNQKSAYLDKDMLTLLSRIAQLLATDDTAISGRDRPFMER